MTENMIKGFYLTTMAIISFFIGFVVSHVFAVQQYITYQKAFNAQATHKYCDERTPFIKEKGDEVRNNKLKNDKDRRRTTRTQGIEKGLH